MKTILNENNIILEAENFADKLFITRFIKEVSKNKLNKNVMATFSYSDDRMYENRPKGGGWADPKKIVDSLFDAEEGQDKHLIAVEEIEALEITDHLL